MRINIHKPNLPKTIRLAFLHYLSDLIPVLVGYQDKKKCQPPHHAINDYLGTGFNARSHWDYEKAGRGLSLYPDLKHHWFGLFMDADGCSYPVQYRQSGNTARVTAGHKTFPWIQNDKHLSTTFIMPLLVRSLFWNARDYINTTDQKWNDLMTELDTFIDELFEALATIQTLKTAKAREGHYRRIQHNLIRPDYYPIKTLVCVKNGVLVSRERLDNLVL